MDLVFFYNQYQDSLYFQSLQLKRTQQPLADGEEASAPSSRPSFSSTIFPFATLPPHHTPEVELGTGFCMGIVFFIFKMLYNSMPESGGMFWAQEFQFWFHKPAKLVDDGARLNPALEDLLWLSVKRLIYTNELQKNREHLGNAVKVLEIFTSATQDALKKYESLKRLLLRLRGPVTRLALSRMQDMQTGEDVRIVREKLRYLLSALCVDDASFFKSSAIDIDTSGLFSIDSLIPLLVKNIHLLPNSFFCIVHHLSQLGRFDNSVFFRFIESIMTTQEYMTKRVGSPYQQHLKSMIRSESLFDNEMSKVHALLYEQYVKPTSFVQNDYSLDGVLVINEPWSTELVVWNYDPTQATHPHSRHYRKKKRNDMVARWFNAAAERASQKDAQCPIKTEALKLYAIKYFMTISTTSMHADFNFDHIICCWSQTNLTGELSDSTFVFDANNGLWKLNSTESIGEALVKLILNEQIRKIKSQKGTDVLQLGLSLDVKCYRGFYFIQQFGA